MMDWKEKWPSRVSPSGQLKRGLSPEEKTEVFIYRANQIHNDTYTYEKFKYLGAKEKTTITCKIHGDFLASPDSHITSGKGCPSCAKNKKKTEQEFIAEAIEVHGDEYDYSGVIFVGVSTKVSILCKLHGTFEQEPRAHLSGNGCPKCYGNSTKTTEEFMAKATKVHSGKYLYNKSTYVTAHAKVIITCPDHGDFQQTPHDHLRPRGCPKCSASPSTHVYLLKYWDDVYKIGVTNNLTRRLAELRRAYQNDIEVIACAPSQAPVEDEKYLLAKYKQCPVLGGRQFAGCTELRCLTKQEVLEICSYLDQN